MNLPKLLVTTLIGTAAFGCAAPAHPVAPRPPTTTPTTPTTHPAYIQSNELDALVDPPPGWKIERSDDTAHYVQRVWVSPTGDTSYGVVHFSLPLPVGNDVALTGFMSQMRQSEGEARLLSKQRDVRAPDRLRFTAEGGRYRLDGIIVTHGLRGWVTYAGLLRNGPTRLDELELSVQSRENTFLGPTGGVKTH